MSGLLDAVGDAVSGAADAVGDAAGAVADLGRDAVIAAACKIAEEEIKKQTDRDIEVDCVDVPSDWKNWMIKTGINSLCTDWTWDFLDKSSWNQRKIEKWEERNIDKIVMTVNENPDDDDRWIVCKPEWETGSKTLKLVWYPRAGNWCSGASWNEGGYKRYWILRDEIVFGLQLYQLPGKCFYKSDWLDNFEDWDPEGVNPLFQGKKKFKRWFQFRHWILYWYREAQWGWNYQWTTKPPPLPDGSDFNLDSILSLPSMPDFDMPSVKLPSLPDVSLPDVSMPDVSLPDAPSISAPSLSAPSIDLSAPAIPSAPPKKYRPDSKWASHGFVELADLKCIAKGKTLVLSNANITHFIKEGENSYIKHEKEEHARLELECTDEEQAASWVETLKGSGVEEGEVGGCCTVA